ncbi:MAG: hypothetical protein WA740_01350 [Candidatus Binataceae bacterium]
MTGFVASWMKANGMTAKPEFVTPWGICDFVGLRFNPEKVTRRLQQKQIRAISSVTRALLLLQIPDVETKRSITLDNLIQSYAPFISEEVVCRETSRLIADRYVTSSAHRRLQKVNGWMPLQDRLVAVELKLSRVDEAMRQAVNNLGFADESYVALPADVARRVMATSTRWSKFFDVGVGLLGVARRRCEVLRPAQKTGNRTDKAIQLYCVEKFWGTRLKGN